MSANSGVYSSDELRASFKSLPETVCIAVLRASPRYVPVTFAIPGTGVVRLHGRRFDGTSVTIAGSVVVRP